MLSTLKLAYVLAHYFIFAIIARACICNYSCFFLGCFGQMTRAFPANHFFFSSLSFFLTLPTFVSVLCSVAFFLGVAFAVRLRVEHVTSLRFF